MPSQVSAHRCNECLMGNSRIVSAERAEDILEECARKGTAFICHKGSIKGHNIVCRGFYDRFPGNSTVAILALFMPSIEVDIEQLRDLSGLFPQEDDE